jgi:hypothetical protein
MPEEQAPENKWVLLDLEKILPENLLNKYDVVFCHMVLEHIFHLQTALDNLAKLTKDVMVLIVPFSQGVHTTFSYGDYFRITPLYLNKYFSDLGFSVLSCEGNEQPFTNVYIVFIASRFPEKYPEFNEANKQFDLNVLPSRFGKYKQHGNQHK